jgi:hypothetical protein
MRQKLYLKPWHEGSYQESIVENMKHWSRKVEVESDRKFVSFERMWMYKPFYGFLWRSLFWHKIAIIEPLGKKETNFHLGLQVNRLCLISPIIQKIGDGMFGVRVGHLENSYFAVGDSMIELFVCSYVYEDSKIAQKYKDLVIY